jgi:DnaJ-class molecular chaperone
MITIELQLYQALFGFNKTITHLDGRILHINYIGKTDYNTTRKICSEGLLPLHSDNNIKGDLYITFIYKLPSIKNELKLNVLTLLQDKDEIEKEENILKMTNLIKYKLID